MFKSLTIRNKLIGTMLIASLMLVIPWWFITGSLEQLADKSEKASFANRIIKLTKEARIEEKNYIQREEPVALQKVNRSIETIQDQVEQFLPRFQGTQNIEQLKQIDHHSRDYLLAMGRFVEQMQRTHLNEEDIVVAARKLEQQATAMRADQKRERESLLLEQSEVAKRLLDKEEKAQLASHIIKLVKEARIEEKNFIIHVEKTIVGHDGDEHADIVLRSVEEIINTADSLIPRLLQQKKIDQMSRLKQSGADYRTHFKRFVAVMVEKQQSQQQMVVEARQLEGQARALHEGQKARRDQLLKEEQGVDLVRVRDRIRKAEMANQITKLTHEARIEEKSYIQRDDRVAEKRVRRLIGQISRLVEELLPQFQSRESLYQLQEIAQRASDYLKALDRFSAQREQEAQEEARMVEVARELEEQATAMRADQKREREALLQQQKEITLKLADKVEKARLANRIIKLVKEARLYERSYLDSGEIEYTDQVNTALSEVRQIADGLLPLFKQQKNIQQMQELLSAEQRFSEEFNGYVALFRERQTSEQQMVTEARELENQALALRESQKQEKAVIEAGALRVMTLSLLVVAAVVVVALMMVLRDLTSRIGLLVERARRIANRQILTEQETQRLSSDELGVVESALYDINLSFREITESTQSIAAGDYAIRLPQRGEQDMLAQAMNRMVVDFGRTIAENRSQNWVQQGVVTISAAIRGEQQEEELASNAITALCEYLGVQVGALYVRREEEQGHYYQLLGSYAYTQRKSLSNRFNPGESLVGQAALEQQPIVVQQVPDDYVKVSSGLGESTPQNIAVYPFSYENSVRGVVELGSVGAFDSNQLEVLNRIVDGLGIAFESMVARTALDKALKASQELTENLQVQQEELQQTNEQLEEQTNALEISQRDVEARNLSLELAQLELNRRAEQLDQSSRYKSEFLVNMSHELRTPLNSILLLSRMIANGGVESEAAQRKNAQVIHDAGTDLLGLINEVLDLSKIEAGKMAVHFSQFALEPFVHSFKALFQPQAQEKGLEFIVEVAPGLPHSLVSDRERLKQVLRNFLSNALKFTDSGSVRIEVAALDQTVISNLVSYSDLRDKLRNSVEQYVVFSVVDSGIGIPQEQQRLVFEAFQQADGSTSRTYGGTGLGLSISNQIAAMLEGGLALQSSTDQLNHGSRFSIVVPLQPSSVTVEEEEEPLYSLPAEREQPLTRDVQPATTVVTEDDRHSISRGEQRVVLLVEDDRRFAQTLIDMGRGHGFKMVHAATGIDGVRLAEAVQPAAILLDIQLPIMDGWEVMRHLKRSHEASHIPVHVISVVEEQPLAYRLGAVNYLLKPVTSDQLEQTFARIEQFIASPQRYLLVVEDNPMEREAITQLLECGEGLVCHQAESGSEALERLRGETPYAAMVLDFRLPDMSGYQLLQQMEQSEVMHHLPTIIYTGKELSQQEERALRGYADSIVLKTADSSARLLQEALLFAHYPFRALDRERQQLLEQLEGNELLFSGRTVLLVDDDIRNSYALNAILENHGLSVITAADGQEALDQLEQHGEKINIVLMDIMMPVMDGYEAMEKIRAQPRFAQLPIIALTAKALKADRERCIASGASDYMTKPIDYEQLLSLLRVWLATIES